MPIAEAAQARRQASVAQKGGSTELALPPHGGGIVA
jgi:hypothetical protein